MTTELNNLAQYVNTKCDFAGGLALASQLQKPGMLSPQTFDAPRRERRLSTRFPT